MNSIVIGFGGLNVGYLGCYGGSWIDTPAFDRLAAEGFVFDRCFVDVPSPTSVRRSWWTGRYQSWSPPGLEQATPPSSPSPLGVRTILIRDSRQLLDSSARADVAFDRVTEIERHTEDTTKRVFAAAADWIEREATRAPYLLFLDCHGAHPPWQIHPARNEDEDQEFHDELRRHYAAVVSHLDEQLGVFLAFLRARSEWDNTLLLVTGDVGTVLGGESDERREQHTLCEELVHVPLMLHVPGGHDPSGRSHALVQPTDLMPTVLDWLGLAIPSDLHGHSLLPIVRLQANRIREYVCMAVPDQEWAIRTPDWHLVLPLSGPNAEASPEPQLFVKPDDRWERNNVAKQFPEVVDELTHRLRSFMAGTELEVRGQRSEVTKQ